MIVDYKIRWARSDAARHAAAKEAALILRTKRRQSDAERRLREKAGDDPDRKWRL